MRYRRNPRGDVRVTPSSIELDRYPEWPAKLALAPMGRRMYTGEDPRKSMYGHTIWIEDEYIPKANEAFKKVQYFVSHFDDKAVRKALDEMGVRYYSGRDDAQALRERLERALYDRLMPYEEKKNPKRPRKRRNPSSIESVFHALQPGDWVEVTYAPRTSTSPNEKRTVTVESRSGRYVYVTSGKVRPGHKAGGAIINYDGDFYYQPTIQQPIRRVFALHRTAVLPLVHNPYFIHRAQTPLSSEAAEQEAASILAAAARAAKATLKSGPYAHADWRRIHARIEKLRQRGGATAELERTVKRIADEAARAYDERYAARFGR